MDNNYFKYLKYKKKYINIKNETIKLIQKAGAPISQDIFTLYTTGLGNWLNASSIEPLPNEPTQNLAFYYNLYKKNLFNQIKDLFPSCDIIVKHYDPLKIDVYNEENVDNLYRNISFITEICKSEEELPNVCCSSLVMEEFDFHIIDTNRPYLILDFAHVFTYTRNPNVQRIGITYKLRDDAIIDINDLNILRFGLLFDIIAKAIFNCDYLFIKDGDRIHTLTKIVQTKIPYSIINYENDPVNYFFSKIIIDGYSQEGELPKVASISRTLATILEKIHIGMKFYEIDTIINKNMNSNLKLLTSICRNLINHIMVNDFPLELKKSGREKLKQIINTIADLVIDEIDISLR